MHAEPSTLAADAAAYDPKAVESRAQRYWTTTQAFEVDESSSKPKYFCLSMLPYPSGALHMGHVRNYTIGDVISRYKRMTGHNVLQPMAWDAFGLPAENAAIKNNTAPAAWTYANIEHMRSQLQTMGYAIDWTREFATCRPEYYVHEQRMFVRLFEKGLVYRKNSVVNWDPVDQTVLANEQVIDGRGWRSGTLVEKREIPQWFLKITSYAQELLNGLDTLDGWPESVKTMQRNWIGRSEGLEIAFALEDSRLEDGVTALKVFTTRPDTLAGATFLCVAAEHPLALAAAEGYPELAEFIAECKRGGTTEAELETQSKRGVFTGRYALHPVTGDRVPIWAANFVLMGYGTGALMAVPAHDERDCEFALKYELPIRMAIVSPQVADAIAELQRDVARHSDPMEAALGESAPIDVFEPSEAVRVIEDFERRIFEEGLPYTDYGILVNSGEYDGLDYESSFDALAARFQREGNGARRVNFRLRDWGVSRQRYWGCPIPMIRCANCGDVPVPEAQLPVVLPENVAFSGLQSPIKADLDWRKTTCPKCGSAAERETDTFDTFMESSWYYARYTSPGAADMVDARANYWLPVDQYIGGIEHAILHLMYFRFYHKLLRDVGLVTSDEPATNLLCQGMVIAETFYRGSESGNREWFNPADVDVSKDERGRMMGATLRADGLPVEIGATEKMAKSKNNGVDPQLMVDRFGADTVRLFSMFAAPPDQSLDWNESGVEGMARFLRRFWREVSLHVAQPDHPSLGNVAAGHSGSLPPHSGGSRPQDGRGSAEGAVDPAQLNASQKTLRRQLHETIQKVGDDYGRRHSFNTAIAALMELLNHVTRFEDMSDQGRAVRHEALQAMVLLLNPVTPHICHALWQALGHAETLIENLAFPQADGAALVKEALTLAVQVNGKLRGTIEVATTSTRQAIETKAQDEPNVARFIEGMTVKKIIIVPGKIVNIVAG